jgi:hypothetical protein
MVDLDRCNFKTQQALKLGLSKTLKTIKENLGGDVNPTVLWSGNGYHVYLVLSSNGVILEYQPIFTDLTDQPSRRFLQFAEDFLSCGKSDKSHNSTVSFKNCMLRVPGSINSKNGAQVKLVQLWDSKRKPEINYLLADFCAYLANQKAQEIRRRYWFIDRSSRNSSNYKIHSSTNQNEIHWIERLLDTPIPDGRKYSIWRILVPYLINRRHATEEQCFEIIIDWLDRCAQLSRLYFNADSRVRDAIKNVGTFGPVYPDKQKEEYPGLYELLVKYMIF